MLVGGVAICGVTGFGDGAFDGFDALAGAVAGGASAGFTSLFFGGCVCTTAGRGVVSVCDAATGLTGAAGEASCAGAAGLACDGICNGSCVVELAGSAEGVGALGVTTTAGGVKRDGIGSGRFGMNTGAGVASAGFAADGVADGDFSTRGVGDSASPFLCEAAGGVDLSSGLEALAGDDGNDAGFACSAAAGVGRAGAASIAGLTDAATGAAGFASCVGTAATKGGTGTCGGAGGCVVGADSVLFSLVGKTTRGVATGVGVSDATGLRSVSGFSATSDGFSVVAADFDLIVPVALS